METREQCIRRAERALDEIIGMCTEKQLDRAGVVTHGGTIMVMLWRFGRPSRGYYDWLTPNCGGWMVTVDKGDLRLDVSAPLEEL